MVNQKLTACLYDESAMAKALHQIPEMAIYTTPYVFSDQVDHIAIRVFPDHYQLLNWVNTYLEEYSIYYTISDLVKAYPEYYRGENL